MFPTSRIRSTISLVHVSIVTLFTLDVCVPNPRCILAHCTQMKMPKLTLAQRGAGDLQSAHVAEGLCQHGLHGRKGAVLFPGRERRDSRRRSCLFWDMMDEETS